MNCNIVRGILLSMIRGIILDVDGVIVGSKKGYNWPMPHPDVIVALKRLREKGIFVSLCTGKGTFAIKGIVEAAHLDNLHIGDGGAVVMDFLRNVVVEKHVIAGDQAQRVIAMLQSRGTYVEVYTVEGYYVQRHAVGHITTEHTAILNREPVIVDLLGEVVSSNDVVKVMPVAKDENEKQEIIAAFAPFAGLLSLQWGIHPTALPLQFGIVTAPNISKRHGALTIAKHTHIPLAQILGVGDGMSDWNFIELCGFAGIMGNASEDLKRIAVTKDEGKYHIGPSVDENGLLELFDHFGLRRRI